MDDPGDGHASRKQAAVPNGHASSAPEQQLPDSQHAAANPGAAAAPTAAAEEPSKKRARKDVSGPSNAEEAELLRKKLGACQSGWHAAEWLAPGTPSVRSEQGCC